MFEKINNQKFTILPKIPKENEALCPHCGGTGWMIDKEKGLLESCSHCYSGVVRLCEHCGNPLNRYGQCKDKECRNKEKILKEQEKELERYKKAKHYTLETVPKEFVGMLYSDSCGYNEGYFTEIEDLEDYCDSEYTCKPSYVWGTVAIPFELNAYDIVQGALEDSYEYAFYDVNDEALKDLQDAMDKFAKAHSDSLTTYYVDYDVCIDL